MSAYIVLKHALEAQREYREQAEQELREVVERGEQLKSYIQHLDAEIGELVTAQGAVLASKRGQKSATGEAPSGEGEAAG